MSANLIQAAKRRWRHFRGARAGERFRQFNEQQRQEAPKWVRPLYLGGAVLSFGIGIVLTVLPGPAVVFFALSAALLAAQSATIAGWLDSAEVRIRRWLPSRHKHPGGNGRHRSRRVASTGRSAASGRPRSPAQGRHP